MSTKPTVASLSTEIEVLKGLVNALTERVDRQAVQIAELTKATSSKGGVRKPPQGEKLYRTNPVQVVTIPCVQKVQVNGAVTKCGKPVTGTREQIGGEFHNRCEQHRNVY